MRNLLNANKKTKVIILVGLVLLLAAITIIINLIVVGTNSKNNFEKYGKTPYDDILTVSVSMYENRYTSNDVEEKTSNDYESSKYSVVTFVTKPSQTGYKTLIKYMRFHLAVETNDGTIVYKDEKKGSFSSSSNAMSESSVSTYQQFSNILVKTVKNASDSIETKDQTPKNIYLKLYYIAEIRNTQSNNKTTKEQTIEYQANVMNNRSVESTKEVREVELTTTNDIKKNSVKNAGKEVFDLNVKYTKAPAISTDRVTHKDDFEFELITNKINLETNKVKNMSFEIIGMLKNEKKDFDENFANAVYLGCFYGSLPTASSLRTISNKVDSAYELEEIRVFVNIVLSNGKTQKTSFSLKTDKLTSN